MGIVVAEKPAAPKYKVLDVRKLSPYIGAEIFGLDLRKPVGPEALEEIRMALRDNFVIFFRDQELNFEQHIAFGRNFGDLVTQRANRLHIKEYPEILVIKADENSTWITGENWHSDMTCIPMPHRYSILRLEEVPAVGGDTLWQSMFMAYESLSESMKSFLSGLTALHGPSAHYSEPLKGVESQDAPDKLPYSEHPVVCTHPETGRNFLYVNSVFTKRIVELKQEESDALLQYLYRVVERNDFFVRFRWQKNSIAFWDNLCTQHHALWDYYPQRRRGVRVAVKGSEVPFQRRPDGTRVLGGKPPSVPILR